jgi:hypothetical protein
MINNFIFEKNIYKKCNKYIITINIPNKFNKYLYKIYGSKGFFINVKIDKIYKSNKNENIISFIVDEKQSIFIIND